ncbi:MAG: ATP-binding cassette domain-containing protein [Candidatus Nanopelagicales bacterium]|nr:ATP-binding cassette domain-containing protein [Candidatus Nanopelagicales bacterium]
MTDMAVGVSARDFGWRYAGRSKWAFRNVDLEIAPGERVLIAGGSGVGKSTLLRALAAIGDEAESAQTAGTIKYRRGSREIAAVDVGQQVGLMMQDPETNLILTKVGDDVAFGLENAQVDRAAIWPRVERSLGVVGFPYGLERPTSALSGGEKQRVALAGLLVRKPGLLILDEPTANLDAEGAAMTVGALQEVLADSGSTLVLVEHRLADVVDLVDRIVVLQPEGILFDGPTAEVLRSRGSELADLGVFVPGVELLPGSRPRIQRNRPYMAGIVTRSPATPETAVLTARDVVIRRVKKGPPVVDGVSLRASRSTAVAVMGPNGAGKSTLARALGGLMRPSQGSVTAAGSDKPLHRYRSRDLCRVVGSVFQEPEHQFVATSARAELAIGARASGLPRRQAWERADLLLDELHLEDVARANPYTLSGGEKRRLAVGAALAGGPGALVLDEPTFGQDLNTWRATVELLIRQLDDQRALVVVTHDAELVKALGAVEYRMTRGRLRLDVEETGGDPL